MAFNIFWKIKFKSLRAGTDYTVNIYKDGTPPSGYPLTLKGGASPFETQESDDEDPFVPIRQQSGYISIVDDGKAINASNAEVQFNWKDLMPQTDLDRPVTLTKNGTVVWQGFMQAQNFSGGLYGNPQEREFPVQCVLTVLAAKDVDITNQKQVHNFAYLINACFAAIGITTSSSPIGIDYLYFQGQGFARAWLLKLIDWQNFVSDDGKGTLTSRFDTLTALTDVCRFWGWTVRTIGRDVYFCCADDMAGAPGFLKVSLSQLQSIANETNTSAGDSVGFVEVDLDEAGDIFASTANDDTCARGASTAVVTANSGTAEDALIEAWPEYIERDILASPGWGEIISYTSFQGVRGSSGEWKTEKAYAKYTSPRYLVQTPFFKVTCPNQSYASIGLAQFSSDQADIQWAVSIEYQDIISLRHNYDSNNPVTLVQIETEFEHVYDGKFSISGDVYKSAYCYKVNAYTLNHSIKMRFGIGSTRETAMWFDGTGYGWSSTPTIFDAHVNYQDGIWRFGDGVYDTISVVGSSTGKKGKVFIDLLGGIGANGWNPDVVSSLLYLDIANFTLKYDRFGYDFLTSKQINLDGRKEYTHSNDNMSRNRWDDDVVYASGNLDFGYGLVFNPSTLTPVVNAEYSTGDMPPEQHLANRVANYWASTKRMLSVELRSEIAAVGNLTPGKTVTLDGWDFYPLAISRQWRDDVTVLNLIEI